MSLSAAMNLVLVGPRASGKTELGRRIAEALGRPFFDLDREIEVAQGRSIRELFEQDGEAAFRDLEAATLAGVSRRSGLVLSPGGGVVERESNRALLRQHWTVYLRVPIPELVERLRRSPGRPALTDLGLEEEVVSVLGRRERWYREVSRLQFDVPSGEAPEESSRRLLEALDLGLDGV